MLYWQSAECRLDFGIVTFIGSSPALVFCKQSLPSPSDWFNKDLMAYIRTGEKRWDIQAKIGSLGENQVWGVGLGRNIYQSDKEEVRESVTYTRT